MTSNTITIRLRRPKAEIEAAAKPNVNAWVNKLLEQALGPRPADWTEHFDRKSRQRRFRYLASEMRRANVDELPASSVPGGRPGVCA